MSDIREIRRHMESVRDTEKVTSAMHMIAATKMRRAKAELDATRPYFDAVKSEIKRAFRVDTKIESKYLYPAGVHDLPGAYAYIVITADKGLAGTYNQMIIKEIERLYKEHESRFFVVGEYGRRYFTAHDIPYESDFLFSAQNPTLQRARVISAKLFDLFNEGKVSKIFVIYTDLVSGMSQKAHVARILPFHRGDFVIEEKEKTVKKPFIFYPSIDQILNYIVESYMTGYIYSALVDSFCSEQSARMNAMDEANSNAEELLSELKRTYNHARQSKITKEITEISSGAKALARKKERRERSARDNER
ncbi:MAG: ATP synthase F1 subunit gamma [Lachnospiraceae bacterium]|nr:ATP synthase F1 subunit gamma [Lachnospiraceae bacterium]